MRPNAGFFVPLEPVLNSYEFMIYYVTQYKSNWICMFPSDRIYVGLALTGKPRSIPAIKIAEFPDASGLCFANNLSGRRRVRCRNVSSSSSIRFPLCFPFAAAIHN